MRDYVVADGEAVGLVCLSVHYKNSGMFVAHDVKAHAPLPSIKSRSCLPVVNDFLLAISCTVAQPRPAPPVQGEYPAPLSGRNEGGNKKIFRKEGQRARPNRPCHN
jgi:hypothetical protein